jgi:protein-disulfide isomerase
MSKGSAIIAILIAFVGGLLIGHLTGSDGPGEGVAEVAEGADGTAAAEAAGEVERYKVPVTNKQPQKGPADALVTIVEFSEFECPFCARVNPTVDRIMKEYDGKVRVVWRNNPLPFHKNATPAAIAALEAHAQGGNDKFWKMHDLLFQNQKQLTRDNLEKYAQQVGLDMGAFRKALDGNKHQASIKEDQALAAELGARGTPNFFINGRNLRGAQPYEKFKELIDDEMGRAQTLVGTGVSKSRVYAEITKGGLTKKAPDEPQKKQQPDPDAVYKVPLTGKEPQHGPDDALVTVVTISEFECPFCKRVEPTLKELQDKYGNDLRIVWLNNPLPFHKNAGPAANAALEAHAQGGNDKFWKMHALLFENQKALDRGNLEKYAQQLGLNMAQFKKALDTEKFKDTIKQQQQLAQKLGASGTPAFFINGRNLRGAQPLAAFTKVVDEELAKAKKRVASGTPRARVYEETIKGGATSPQFVDGPAGAGDKPKADKPDPDKVYDIPLPKDAPTKGPKNAKVTIQIFSDFECPFCSRVVPTIDKIAKEYSQDVQFIWRDYPLPFHKKAMPAHQAAREVYRQAGSDAFWKYHDKLFENSKALDRGNLEQWAQELGGINMAEFKKALDTNRHEAGIKADMDAVQKAGARIGTPSFFINGKLLQGAQPHDAFKIAVNKALKGS